MVTSLRRDPLCSVHVLHPRPSPPLCLSAGYCRRLPVTLSLKNKQSTRTGHMTRLLGERLSGFFALMMKNKKTKKEFLHFPAKRLMMSLATCRFFLGLMTRDEDDVLVFSLESQREETAVSLSLSTSSRPTHPPPSLRHPHPPPPRSDSFGQAPRPAPPQPAAQPHLWPWSAVTTGVCWEPLG